MLTSLQKSWEEGSETARKQRISHADPTSAAAKEMRDIRHGRVRGAAAVKKPKPASQLGGVSLVVAAALMGALVLRGATSHSRPRHLT